MNLENIMLSEISQTEKEKYCVRSHMWNLCVCVYIYMLRVYMYTHTHTPHLIQSSVFVVVFWPCCVACGILALQPEVEPSPRAVKAQSLNHWTTKEFPRSSVDGHFGCFHILAIVNNVTINIGVHVYFQISVFIFSGYIPWNGIAGSYGSPIFSF